MNGMNVFDDQPNCTCGCGHKAQNCPKNCPKNGK